VWSSTFSAGVAPGWFIGAGIDRTATAAVCDHDAIEASPAEARPTRKRIEVA